VKYCKIAGSLRWSGGMIILHRGQSIDDDHPLVKERPDLWEDEEPGAQIASARVESGMQRPGEARTEKPPVVQAPPRNRG
jgi:hypothetical protein